MDDVVGRPEWLIRHLTLVPGIVDQLRAQIVPSMQAPTEGRVSGSTDRSSAPLRVEPLDELDELWAVMWEVMDELCERASLCFCVLREVSDLRGQQPLVMLPVPDTVRGFRSSSPAVIARDTFRMTQWLLDHAWPLALGHHFTDPVNDLVERIDRLHQVAGLAPIKAYRTSPCGLCGHRAVRAEWREDGGGLAAWVCDNCENRLPARGA